MLDKNTIFKLLSVYIFSKYVNCDMRFFDIKLEALLCFLNGWGIAVLVFIY